MKWFINIVILILFTFVIACSSDNESSGDHVWKEQTDTIKKAEEVEAKILKSVELQKKTIEEQSQ